MVRRGFPGVTVLRDNGKDEPAPEKHLDGAILPMSDGPMYCYIFPLLLCFFLRPSHFHCP